MSHSPIPNTPNQPPNNNSRRNQDEWIAVLVALLAMGGIFFWVFGKDSRQGGLNLARRPSDSTQVQTAPSLSQFLNNPLAVETSIPSDTVRETSGSSPESGFSPFQTNPSTVANRRRVNPGVLIPGVQPTQTPTPEETEATEAPADTETEETPVTVPEATEVPTDTETEETPDTQETPEAEGATEGAVPEDTEETTAETPEETETATATDEASEPEETTAETPEETETATATDEASEPEDTAAETPEETETATATDEASEPEETAAETPEETETATATDEASEPEEEAAANQNGQPRFGLPIPGLGGGSQSEDTEETTAASAEFSDVSADYWAKDYIAYSTEQQIVEAYEDGTFKPDEPVTRASVASQIENAFAFEANGGDNVQEFEDVTSEYWAKPDIEATTQTGFLSGYPGDVFRPDQSMTRTEVIVALVSGLDLKPSENPEETLKVYQDADQIPEWAVEKVAAATEAGLVVSHPNTNQFNPSEPATRAEVSAMIYQALTQAGKVEALESEYIVNPQQ